MTVRLINESGQARSFYVEDATNETAAIRTACRHAGQGYRPAWVLPGRVDLAPRIHA